MKSIIKFAVALTALLTLNIQPADAQLGKLLKKAKEVLVGDDATATQQGKTAAPATRKIAAVPSACGGMVENPFKDVVDIDLIGAYGESTSLNYGKVYLVFKVKMIANKTTMGIGGWHDGAATSGVDQDGNMYKQDRMASCQFDVTEGVYVKLKMDGQDAWLCDVKKTAKTLQVLRVSVYVDPSNRGFVTFKDVPILWDQKPE